MQYVYICERRPLPQCANRPLLQPPFEAEYVYISMHIYEIYVSCTYCLLQQRTEAEYIYGYMYQSAYIWIYVSVYVFMKSIYISCTYCLLHPRTGVYIYICICIYV